MGEYTLANDEIFDAKVHEHLAYIVRAICSRIKPISIILGGSFGRGEGSIVLVGDKVRVISDYEIFIVSNEIKARGISAALSRTLSRDLAVETSISWMTPNRLYCNRKNNASFGSSGPSISMYEIKEGSKTLYGRDLTRVNPIDARSIPLWEGIRLLLNRMAESFSSASEEVPHFREKWIVKTLIACGDILLLDNEIYHYSYRERRDRLANLVHTAKCPGLDTNQSKYVIEAYDTKMFGNYEEYDNGKLKTVKHTVDNMLRYALRKEMSVVFSSYDTFPDAYLSAKRSFRRFPVFSFYSITHPILENLIYLTKLLGWNCTPRPKILSRINIPWHHVVYSVIPSLYFFESLSEAGKEKTMNYANEVLSLFDKTQEEDVEKMKTTVSRLWLNICVGKNI